MIRPASSADHITTIRLGSTQPIAAFNTQACTASINVMFADQDEPVFGGPDADPLTDGQFRSALIVNRGKQQDISSDTLMDTCSALCKSISAGSHELPDARTAQAVQDTLREALHHSPSFQHAVRFGMDETQIGCSLSDVLFAMDSGDDASRPADRREALSPDPAVMQSARNDATTAASESDTDDEITIYVSAPPPPNTPQMDHWKVELIHMILKVITGATKPQPEDENEAAGEREGAKVLAYVVAEEMNWDIPDHLKSWMPDAERQPSFPRLPSIDPAAVDALSRSRH